MSVYLQDADVTLHHGDSLETLRGLPDEGVNCVVTSPPYWCLRDYNVPGQLGLEATPEEYIARMVAVFREVRRVLRRDGTCWVNMGSSFASGDTAPSPTRQPRRAHAYGTGSTAPPDSPDPGSAYLDLCDGCRDATPSHHDHTAGTGQPPGRSGPPPSPIGRDTGLLGSGLGLPAAAVLDVPASTTPRSSPLPPGECSHCANCGACLAVLRSSSRDARLCVRKVASKSDSVSLASALRNPGTDAWGTAWLNYKPKDLVPMPWLLAMALQADGWYLRSEVIWSKPNPMPESVTDRPTKAHEFVFLLTRSPRYWYDAEAIREPNQLADTGWVTTRSRDGELHGDGQHAQDGRGTARVGRIDSGRNARSVWEIATQPYPEAHFACVDAETECLTAEGWKRHEDIRPGDLAAQFDMERQRLSWGTVEDVARYDVAGQEMVAARSRDLDVLLTPNHRCVVQRRHPRTRTPQSPAVVRADTLRPSHLVPTAAPWDHDGDASLPLEWAELIGWYIAEGYEAKQTLAVELYQSETANPAKVARIEALLRQVGAEWTAARARREWRGREATSVAFRVTGYAAARLRELAPAKRIPRAALLWRDDRIEALTSGLLGGDGHLRTDGRLSFVQKDYEQASMLQALAIRLGRSASLSRRLDGICTVYLTKHRTRSFRGTGGVGVPIGRTPYTGIVWCPKLPQGTWVARRNGRVFITGNTFPEELARRCILAGCPEGGVVLDPFAGSGTVGHVARKHGRRAVLIELSEEYCGLAAKRLAQQSLLAEAGA